MLRLQKIKKGYYFHSTDDQQILSASKNSRLSPAVVTISGLADPKKDLWAEASFSGIRNFAICEVISQALSPPVYCDNDCQAFALAKMVFGACRDVKDFLYVNVSNSIGGAVVAGGKLVYGARGNAGEFGHCIVMPGCRPCKCGSNGCLKMYAAGLGIAHTYQEAGKAPQTDGKPVQGNIWPNGPEVARSSLSAFLRHRKK